MAKNKKEGKSLPPWLKKDDDESKKMATVKRLWKRIRISTSLLRA